MNLKEILHLEEKFRAVTRLRDTIPSASSYPDCILERLQSDWDAYRIFADKTSGTFAGISPEGNFNVYVPKVRGNDLQRAVQELIQLKNGIAPRFYRENIEAACVILQNETLRDNKTLLQPMTNYLGSSYELPSHLFNRDTRNSNHLFFRAQKTANHLHLVTT